METQFWNFREKTEVARAVGVKPSYLSGVLAGDRGVSVQMARKLEAATIVVLGSDRVIPAAAWLRLEKHPAMDRPLSGVRPGEVSA